MVYLVRRLAQRVFAHGGRIGSINGSGQCWPRILKRAKKIVEEMGAHFIIIKENREVMSTLGRGGVPAGEIEGDS